MKYSHQQNGRTIYEQLFFPEIVELIHPLLNDYGKAFSLVQIYLLLGQIVLACRIKRLLPNGNYCRSVNQGEKSCRLVCIK